MNNLKQLLSEDPSVALDLKNMHVIKGGTEPPPWVYDERPGGTIWP